LPIIKNMLFLILLAFSATIAADFLNNPAVNTFIDHMVANHNFDRSTLEKLFASARKSESILNAISKPAEALPWHKYRSIFIQPDRIEQGLIFWKEHRTLLEKAENEYGVPAEIVVAIMGVETRYGKFKGKDRVLDALSTLAFYYPKRSDFFRGELEQFLLLTREQEIDPLSLNGSYAGAMGIPQFIPSSYRNFAVDFDQDGRTDLWTNTADAIGSIANYFKIHGWKSGETVVVSGTVTGNKYTDAIGSDLKPDIIYEKLASYGIEVTDKLPADSLVKVMSLDGVNGEEIWLGLNNFYVITRYNHSPLYAMAVYQLSEAIKKKYLDNQAG
jgi:membrane-bound lytic murein transglycosylase B